MIPGDGKPGQLIAGPGLWGFAFITGLCLFVWGFAGYGLFALAARLFNSGVCG